MHVKEDEMAYYFSKTLKIPFDEAIQRATDALKKEGFGIMTEIDVRESLKKKLGVDFRPYRILGACNPSFAHKALQIEDKIGTMLPCNVIVQELSAGVVEVAAIDPVASMQAIENPALRTVAEQVSTILRRIIDSL